MEYRKSKPVLMVLVLCVLAGNVYGQAFSDYQYDTEHLTLSPATQSGAAAGFANPAAWRATDRSGSALWWNDLNLGRRGLDNWGFSTGRRLGFAAQHRSLGTSQTSLAVTDWQLGLAFGDRAATTGIAWRWTTGDKDQVGRRKAIVLGHINRPNRYLALGFSGAVSVESNDMTGSLDLGLRPFGTNRLTLVGDYSLDRGMKPADGRLGVGFEVRPVPGMHLGVKFRDADFGGDIQTVFSMGLTFHGSGLRWLPAYNKDGDLERSTYLLETGPAAESFRVSPMTRLARRSRVIVPMNLSRKSLTYQKYKYMDGSRIAWLDMARYLDAVMADESVGGVALHLSGFRGRPSLIWEMRNKLKELREHDKQVLIHVDRTTMLLYDLASVASHLSMDPEGMMLLPGLQTSRTYMADALDKIGIGFTALQYFPHKTAVEAMSRTDMSDGDREQRGRMIDVIYEEIRRDVCEGRNMSPQTYDEIIDTEVMIDADRALELGLVDTVGRWHDLEKSISTDFNSAKGGVNPTLLRKPWDRTWGEPEHIVVVHAIGECAMDDGIKGRSTGRFMRGLVDDDRVAAVVLRADSPGGDPLPSDLVAEATTMLKDAGKPVVISQGDVAASGGYWISMNGSHVMTTPLTITGSIGVIAGWVWDKSLHEKAGLNSDGVMRGKHSTLFRNVRYPGGITLPDRAMNGDELDMARARILKMYDRFVDLVAEGRDLAPGAVRELGGGRIWMGEDAVGHRLCDEIGGLQASVAKARELAGLSPDAEIRIVEYPPRPFFEFPEFELPIPGLSIGLPLFGGYRQAITELDNETNNPELEFLKVFSTARGRPLTILPPHEMPDYWREKF
jgi:protease IV